MFGSGRCLGGPNLLMEIFISVTGPMVKLMVLGSTITMTERISTTVNGRTINSMGKDMKSGC